MTDARNETEWAAVTVAYGTGALNVKPENLRNNLLITEAEFRALGLHKPTVLNLTPEIESAFHGRKTIS
jgi:hypothetical protein